jgi:hypothetical protein
LIGDDVLVRGVKRHVTSESTIYISFTLSSSRSINQFGGRIEDLLRSDYMDWSSDLISLHETGAKSSSVYFYDPWSVRASAESEPDASLVST